MFGVLRIINAKICWLNNDGSFAQPNESTYRTDDRERAYQRARVSSGLLCQLPTEIPSAKKLEVVRPPREVSGAQREQMKVQADELVQQLREKFGPGSVKTAGTQ